MINKDQQIGRRQFLIASSTCAVAAATVGPDLFAGAVSAPPRRLAIGYSAAGENGTVFAAAALRAGDDAFIDRGARITVNGSSGAASPAKRRAVDVLAHFLDEEKGTLIPFRAWVANRTNGAQGSIGAFTMPVDRQHKVILSVEAERGTPAGKTPTRRDTLFGNTTETVMLPVTLSLRNEPNSVKLARGAYIIVPMFAGDREPKWSSYTLGTHAGRVALVDRDGVVAPFDHFVMSVDYAKKA